MHLCLIYLYTIFQHFIRYINIICSTMFDIFKSFYHICNIAKLLYITFPQLPSAPLQFAVCCRRIPSNKDSLHPVGCRLSLLNCIQLVITQTPLCKVVTWYFLLAFTAEIWAFCPYCIYCVDFRGIVLSFCCHELPNQLYSH